MSDLIPPPDSVVRLGSVPLQPMDAGEGAPPTAWTELGPLFHGGRDASPSFGVWEMQPGVASDTEEDEVFVVLSGEATIAFLDSGRELEIGPGDFVRLAAGSRTRWTVARTLRKLYVAP